MSLHRRAAKRDSNEPAIVSALEKLGCVVWRVSGKGLPDLVVFYRRRAGKHMDTTRHTFVADVKGPKEKATPAQEEKWTALTNLGFSVFILRTPEDAQKMLNNALQPWEPEMYEKVPGGLKKLRLARKVDAVKVPEWPKTRKGQPGYNPPRSKPVDAAKEAEATFAPRNPCCGNYEAFGIHAEVCEHYAG